MLKITIENARKWVMAAAVCLFISAAAGLLTGGFHLLDMTLFGLCGFFTLRKNSRAASTIGFASFVVGKMLSLDAVCSSSIVFLMVMGLTLCLLQGMRATYFIHKYGNFAGVEIDPKDVHEVIDADFEFIEIQDNQSKGQS